MGISREYRKYSIMKSKIQLLTVSIFSLGQPKNYTGKKTEMQPFNLKTDLRVNKNMKEIRRPFLIIELVIAPGRKAKIPLYTVA